MMIKFIAPKWVEGLAKNLEAKYKSEVGNINFLDLWVDFWYQGMEDALAFFSEIGAEDIEIKAWLYMKGNDLYEQDLLDEFASVI